MNTSYRFQMKEKRVINASICQYCKGQGEALQDGRVSHQQFPTEGPSVA
jgi:hypothetical protein